MLIWMAEEVGWMDSRGSAARFIGSSVRAFYLKGDRKLAIGL
jgi:hypothetical protein